MPNVPMPPAPSHRDTAEQLRRLALALMDAADCYDDGEGAAGQRAALIVAQQVRELVNPKPE